MAEKTTTLTCPGPPEHTFEVPRKPGRNPTTCKAHKSTPQNNKQRMQEKTEKGKFDPEKDTAYKHVKITQSYNGVYERRNRQMRMGNLVKEAEIETPSGRVTVEAMLDPEGNANLLFTVDL